MTNRLYSKEQIEEWASKRADDAGRLSRQLLDVMRENERLRHLLKRVTQDTEYSCMPADLQEAIESELSNKESNDKS